MNKIQNWYFKFSFGFDWNEIALKRIKINDFFITMYLNNINMTNINKT